MSEDYSSIDYQMSILQAAKEGKAIEVCALRLGRPSGDWAARPKYDYPFNFVANCYRVKKEPRRFNVWCKDDSYSKLYPALPGQDHKLWRGSGWELIEVVEVVK